MNNLGNKKTMAENIKYYMSLNNKTRNEVCDALGFRYSTFSEWLNARKYPRIDKIELLANYFGISKSDLVEKRESRLLPAAVVQPAIPDIGYIPGAKGNHDVPPDPRPSLEHPGICPHPAVPR